MEKAKTNQNAFSAMGKWFYAFIATAVLLIGAVVAIVIIALGAKGADEPPAIGEGDETGIYYYDAALGEYLLMLNSGNQFTIAGPDINKSGEYTVTENTLTLDFVRDEDGTAQATLNGSSLSLVYKDATMNFLKKIPYSVSFNAMGGSEVESVTVINGKTVIKPNDPTKEGSVFLGWYADEAYTEAFFFGTTPVFENTTVYAKWAETVPGKDEFVVDFDLGFDGGAMDAISTVGGKLVFNAEYEAPTREGYTFVGWFVSAYEDGSKLTYVATENTELNANTTLFAVWADNSATKLQTPAVSVVGNTLSWAAVEGATSYAVTITDAEGNVIANQPSVGATTFTYDFAAAAPGDYEIKVVAKGTSAEDSDAAIRYYQNKGLGRVYKFEVVGDTVIFNAVENAEKYLITIDCGNDQHNHTLFDNGKSTYFNFANCPMQVGGITFTVTAVADGYASTTSETYVYVRNLDKVTDITYDAATATFKWTSVANASKYYVSITCGAHTHALVDNGALTSYSVKGCSGDITITVIPASNGYNSPEGTAAQITKTTPATPTNITIDGMTVAWDAVEGAKSYIVKVDGTSYNVTGTSYNLQDTGISFTTGAKHTISVTAIGATDSSVASDIIETSYLTMGKVSYNQNTVSWSPVLGVTKFDVRVNGGESFSVANVTEAKVVLTQAGVNKIEVRPSGLASEWSTVEVYAYEVVYETRSLNGSVKEYVAKGDAMMLPTDFTYAGFDFDGWYNTPGAAEGNGSEYTERVFVGNGNMTLYANWAPKTYSIILVGIDETMSGAQNESTANAVYTKNFTLPVMTTTDLVKSNFAGWYTGPGGTGVKLTDYLGNSVAPYSVTDDSYAYPYFTSGLIFELKADNTYAVKKGTDINTIPVVTIPATYNGIAVTTILENGFYNCDSLVEIHIPDTITLIGTGAFSSCDRLVSFDVYEVETETPHEVFYHSYEGALLYDDVASGYTYLEAFPRAKKGAFVVPETVDVVRNRAFNYCNISSLTISKEVLIIGDYAFSNCRSLKDIVFEEGGTTPVSVANTAFYGCYSATYIKLPALIKGSGENDAFSVAVLDQLTALQTIEVEKVTGAYFSAVEGMLCNDLGDTILYCPKAYTGISGVLTIPKGITAIGEATFANRNAFTEIIIPNYVTEIGASAFAGCRNVAKITIEGQRSRDLTIGSGAFQGCSKAREVIFEGSGNTTVDAGKTTIGASAFGGMSELRTLTVEAGANIAEIGSSAFAFNLKLRNINVADTAVVTKIGNSAFQGCEALTSFTIPASTTAIGNSAFADCTFISKIVFAPNGQNIDFGSYVFQNCVALSKVELPATVQSFDGSAFDGCYSLTEIVVDPANTFLTTKGGVLYNKNFTEIMFYPKGIDDPDLSELPWNTLTTIGNTVFKDNTNVTSVTIPANVTVIGDSAFNGCVNLTSVTIANGGTDLKVGSYAFANCQKLTAISLPSYTSEIGTGAFYVTPLTAFTIPANVTSIGARAFMYTNLESITIPASVTFIGDGAFAYTKLTSLVIEDGTAPLVIGDVTDIRIDYDYESLEYSIYGNPRRVFPQEYVGVEAYGAFTGTSIKELALPARVTSIGVFTFYEQTNLKTVTIAKNSNLTTIGDGAFYGAGITSINLEDTKVATIGEHAFTQTQLTGVKFPNTLALLDKHSFSDVGKISSTKFTGTLTSVEFATGGTTQLTIKEQAFRNSAFETITFPKNLYSCSETIQVVSNDITYAVLMPSFYRIFEGNERLAAINVEEGCELYASHEGVFYFKGEGGALNHLVMCPPAKTGTYTVPKTVTKVAQRAFYHSQLSVVNFEEFAKDDPNYGKAILELGTADTSNSVTAYAVFGGTNSSSGLRTANAMYNSYRKDVVKTSVTNSHYIKASAIVEINFPSHVKSVGSHTISAIKNAGLVVTFNQDSALVEFKTGAIRDNSGLVTLILPRASSLSTRPDWYANTFSSNAALKEVKFAEGSTFTILPHSLFNGCKALETIEIPSCVTLIEELCFSGCSMLSSVTFAEGCKVEGIETNAFKGTALTEFVIPDTVTYLGNAIFDGVKTLTKVTLGKGIQTIEAKDANGYTVTALRGCASIQEICVANNHPTLSTENGVLYDLHKTIVYYFPPTKSAEGFELPLTVRTIAPYAFEKYTGTSINLHEGITHIQVGAFYQSALTSVTVPSTTIEIGNYAFYNAKLATVTFAENSQLTTIGSHVFYNCLFTTIDIPDSVSSMGIYALGYCKKLTNVIMPAALEKLSASMFYQCTALKSVVLQNNISGIYNNAFYGCNALTTIEIPASVSYMEYYVFQACKGLQTVTFAEGSQLTEISYMIFNGCTSLKSITFPEGVTSIGQRTFDGCTSLEYVDMSKTAFTSLDSSISNNTYYGFFNGCTNLKTVLLPETMETIQPNCFKGCAKLEAIAIPSSVTTIGDGAFDGCASLASVTFGEDSMLTNLGSNPKTESAIFRGTTALTTIKLPDTIATIGASVFENSGLTEIVLPDSLTAISVAAFKGCENLTAIAIPGSVMDVHEEAFMNCVSLETLTIAEGVEYLGANAFGNCTNVTEIIVPTTVMRMGGNPFANCTGLTNFVLATGNESFVIDQTGVLYDVNMRTVIFYPSYVTSETYEMPSTVFELASSAFAGSQLKSVVISDNIKVIPAGCFKGSTKLASVTIPLSVLSIEAEAFMDCATLNNVEIPTSCTNIGTSAFENCTSLTSFDFGTRNTVLTTGDAIFRGCTALATIELPNSLVAITDYMFANTGLTSVVVPDSVTNLEGFGLFEGCTKLVSAQLPEDYVGGLGARAFYGCTSLASIVIPDGVLYIGDEYWGEYGETFMNCTSLADVTFGSSIGWLGNRCFANCTSLKVVDMSGTEISATGNFIFENCTGLETAILSDWYYDLGMNAFDGCINLTGSIEIPYVWWYGGFFRGCVSIDEVHVYDMDMFENCYYDGDEWLDCVNGNFEGMTSRTKIYFHNYTYEDLGDIYFYDEDPYCFPMLNSEARVFDCDGNEVFYDGEACIVTKVVSPDGEILWEYE